MVERLLDRASPGARAAGIVRTKWIDDEGITHDVLPYFMERFESAYLARIQDFVNKVRHGEEPAVTGADAVAAMRVSLAATRSLHENWIVEIEVN